MLNVKNTMTVRPLLFSVVLWIASASLSFAGTLGSASSPDGQIGLELLQENTGEIFYRVLKNGSLLVGNSQMNISSSRLSLSGLPFIETTTDPLDETYSLPSGKKSIYRNVCNEMTATFQDRSRTVKIIIRVYNDGYAYRYYLSYPLYATTTITSEQSEFVIPGFETSWAQKYVKDYSWYYEPRDWQETVNGVESGLYSAPVLVKTGSNYVLLTEAANTGDYAVSKFKAGTSTGKYSLEKVGEITASMPLYTPWRVAMIGSMPQIVESVMVENLNPATSMQDLSWIKPGRSSWDWGGEDANNSVGFSIAKKYIDLAASMDWEYFLLDDGWESSSADYTLQDIVDYASSHNVGVLVWSHQNRFSNNEDQMRNVLQQWKNIGVKGIKVDFWEDDSQSMMQKYDKLIKVAGELELLVNLHGCTKPSGTRRTCPHLLTTEAVLGGEFYLFNSTMTPANHNINLALTRNVIGPIDYTPGDFGTKSGQTLQNTSWAHQMALLTIFESGIQHFVDCPQNYNYHIAEQFLKKLPVAWDDIRCLEARPEQYVTIARKKGDDWYVASLCNEARTLSLSLDFLPEGKNYSAYIYKDGICKTEIQFEYKENLTLNTVLSIPLLATGGVTIQFSTNPDLPKPSVSKYEAESSVNTLKAGAAVVNDGDNLCSGNKYVGNIGKGATLTFNKVIVPETGRYAMTVFYMTMNKRSAYVKINGSTSNMRTYTFNSTKAWSGDGLGFQTVIVNLDSGENTIEIGNSSGDAPNIDRIYIQKADKKNGENLHLTSFDYTDTADKITSQYPGDNLKNLTDNDGFSTYTVSGNTGNLWIQYLSDVPVVISGYSLTSGDKLSSCDPKSWTLEVSNNGNDWTTVDSRSNQIFIDRNETNIYQTSLASSDAAYTYYRLNISANNGGQDLCLAEWQLFGYPYPFRSNANGNGGTMTSQYEGVGAPWYEVLSNLADGSRAKYCVTGQTVGWMQYESPDSILLNKYTLMSAGDLPERNPRSWRLWGANTGKAWVELDNRTGQDFMVNNHMMEYSVQTSEKYTKFRLELTSNNGASDFQIAEWQLFDTPNDPSPVFMPEIEQVRIFAGKGKVSMYSDTPGQYHITNISGQLIKTGIITPGANYAEIPVAGFYIVRIYAAKDTFTAKISVNH